MSNERRFEAVGQRIAELRANLTQADFAARLGVDRKTVVRWEAGERLPDGTSLLAMAQQFGGDINYILTGAGGYPASPHNLSRRAQALLDNYENASPDGQAAMDQMGVLLAQHGACRCSSGKK